MTREHNQSLLSDLGRRFRKGLLGLVPLKPGAVLVVAFSGGPDSTALLHLCLELKSEFRLDVIAAHLDHGLRGDEAVRDRLAAQAAAEAVGAAFHWEKVDCRKLAAAESMSPEEAARAARYAFLGRVKEQIAADYVLTGHTADDNAEMLLLNLLRGSGPKGLSGIPPIRDGYILRPLLGCWRRELLAYLTENGLTWVEDSSNRDLTLTRNRVRHDLIPHLARDYNPAIQSALVRTAVLLRDEESVWVDILAEARHEVGWGGDGHRVWMQASTVKSMKRALARRLIREGVQAVRGETMALSMDHVETVLDRLAQGTLTAQDLPGGVRVRLEDDRLVLSIGRPKDVELFDYPLAVPGTVHIRPIDRTLTAELFDISPGVDPTRLTGDQAALDFDRLALPLQVRNIRSGDRFRPLGMTGTKKLHDFFIDAKVPADQRRAVPIVLDRRGIIWVGGHRPGEDVRLRPETRRVLRLTLD